MHIACKCLNVYIKSRGAEIRNVNVNDIELAADERADNFFRENIASIQKLEGITKEQPSLVETRNVGSWIIHRCYNCSSYTHAIHREYGAALVLINSNIITTEEEINRLRSSPDYSPIFRIIIDRSTLQDFDYLEQPTKFSVSQMPSGIQVALGGLQQQLEEAVQHQAAMIEDRIRAYTAEQYQLLEQFRERAHNEHRLLARLICNSREMQKVANSMETPPATPDSFKADITTSVIDTVNESSQLISTDKRPLADTKPKQGTATGYPKAAVHLNRPTESKEPLRVDVKGPRNIDAEALFPLEGMEDSLSADQHRLSEIESDTDDSGHDDGIHMSRGQRGGHPTLAKSLPVSVPIFPSCMRQTIHDQDDDQLSRDPLDPHNIRASIKALAKSVHGDTVFGDLPRPRFSTQI